MESEFKKIGRVGGRMNNIKYLKNLDLPLVLYGVAEFGKNIKSIFGYHNIKIDIDNVLNGQKYHKRN